MKKETKEKLAKLVILIILGILYALFNKNFGQGKTTNIQVTNVDGLENIEIITGEDCLTKIQDGDENLRVYYFDVGQADSILIVNENKTMLIDAGNNEDGDLVVNNLQKLGITKIDYLIGTHPHEDHIGGLDDVIDNFEIGTIYMPKVQTNTKTFEDVLDSVSAKNLSIRTPKIGYKFSIGSAECEVMSIGNNSENLNECSIVIRMVKEDISYLFTGDAEENNECLRKWPQTTILKVGHHGSSTSSSKEFLNQVMPSVAIIQVGEDNKYGHPHKETMERLNNLNTKIYMTKDVGDILILQK